MEKYVLKANEAIVIPVEPSKIPPVVKTGVKIVWVAIIVLSLLFRTNLLGEMSGLALALLVGVSIAVLFSGQKTEFAPSEMELRFYDDKLVLYRPKRYYDERVTRREFCEMKYADITSCVYKMKSERIHFYGDGVTTWYNMKKDGTFSEKPTKVNRYKKGLLYFSTRCADGVDFVKEIEEHSPLRIRREDT